MKTRINQNHVISFFDNTSKYTDNNVIIELRKSILKLLIGDISNQKIIDIGCGNGDITLQFINCNHITFVDISKNMLNEVEKRVPFDKACNVSFINSSIELINTSEKYDIIISFGLLAHVPEISDAISKFKDLISKEGKLYIQFTDQSKVLSKIMFVKNVMINILKKDKPYNTNRITLGLLKTQLEQFSLIIEKNIGYYPVLPFMKYLSFERRKRFLEFLSSNHFLSGLGSEVVLVIKNQG